MYSLSTAVVSARGLKMITSIIKSPSNFHGLQCLPKTFNSKVVNIIPQRSFTSQYHSSSLVGNSLTSTAGESGVPRNLQIRRSSQSAYNESIHHPEKFWGKAAQEIKWFDNNFDSILDQSNPPFYRWFEGGKLNTCYNCLDRHIEEGFGDRLAIIYDSPVTNTIKKYTNNQLLDEVTRLSYVMLELGVKKHDTVLIYMPNIPEAVIAMLACARIGAVHSVVFGELAVRIRDAKPSIIISTSVGVDGSKVLPYKPLLDAAIELAANDHLVTKTIILQRDIAPCKLIPGRDVDWREATSKVPSNTKVPCVALKSSDPLYILYTSGTTGSPKGVLRDNGGYAVALKWAMKNIFDVHAGEVFWAASDVGWVVGHSFSVYGPLINGNTTVIYEGKPVGTPDASNFWRTIERHKVVSFFTAPTALRAIKKEDRAGNLAKQFDLSHLRSLFLAGEHADKDTIQWAENSVHAPVIDNWWQTETGWPICANVLGSGKLTPKYGSCFQPVPGYNLQVLDDKFEPVPRGTLGNLAIKLPLPPGSFLTLYNNDKRFIDAYMKKIPGYYDTGDAGIIDEDGYVFVMSRTDDVINVAGHRLSTGAMEEAISEHPDIAEAAVVGVKCDFRGQTPLGLVVLSKDCPKTENEIQSELVNLVREKIGPVAFFKKAIVVSKLPKTRSGKVLRATLRSMANGDKNIVFPSTCEDPSAFEEARKVILAHSA